MTVTAEQPYFVSCLCVLCVCSYKGERDELTNLLCLCFDDGALRPDRASVSQLLQLPQRDASAYTFKHVVALFTQTLTLCVSYRVKPLLVDALVFFECVPLTLVKLDNAAETQRNTCLDLSAEVRRETRLVFPSSAGYRERLRLIALQLSSSCVLLYKREQTESRHTHTHTQTRLSARGQGMARP